MASRPPPFLRNPNYPNPFNPDRISPMRVLTPLIRGGYNLLRSNIHIRIDGGGIGWRLSSYGMAILITRTIP